MFLLSPARTDGKRARLMLRPGAAFPAALEFQSASGAQLGDVFSFTSGLYFRGKLTYARRFADPPTGAPGVLVITAGRGLAPPETRVTPEDLVAMGKIDVGVAEQRFIDPLMRDAAKLRAQVPTSTRVVLLGSIASDKYAGPLLEVFAQQLCFPAEFVGRGDMSRGGLLLRHAAAGTHLRYIALAGAQRHGVRPARLDESPGVPPRPRR